MKYHDPNTYKYELYIENGLTKNIFCGIVIANTRPKAIDKLVQGYNCDKDSIKLRCIPYVENNSFSIKLCPKCKSELIKDSSYCYTTSPQQYDYVCKKCGYKDTDI